jgi:hypothetical protein
MGHPELEEKLYQAGQAMKRATGENIIVLCKQYLALLDEIQWLWKLQDTARIDQPSTSFTSPEELGDTSQAIRASIGIQLLPT